MARILFIDQYASLGGGQRILLDVVQAFAEGGHVCHVALPGSGEVTDALDILRIKHHPLTVPQLTAGKKSFGDAGRFLSGSRRLAREIQTLDRELSPDIVYVNGPRCVLGAVLAGAKSIVIAIHLIHGGLERRLLSWCFARRQVKLVTFCSRFAMAPFEGLAKGRVVENWVSPTILAAPNTRAESRTALGLDDQDIAVGVLGRISPHKGQAFLCQALLPVLTEAKGLRLFVAGGRDHEADQRDTDLPASRFITELGKVGEPTRFLDAMDILVVPSLWEEPFGLVAVEGMARGLPVIATDSGCLPEIVDDGVTGLIVPRVLESVRSAVNALAADIERRAAMGHAGRCTALKRFEPHARLRELMNLVLN